MNSSKIYIDVTDTVTQLALAGTIGGIQRVVLSICARLGESAQPVYIDFSTGRCFPVWQHELDFYALIEALTTQLSVGLPMAEVNRIILAQYADRPLQHINSADRVLFLGGPWNSMPHASGFIARISEQSKVICLVHDLLPIFEPEKFRGDNHHFERYFRDLARVQNITWVAAAETVIADMHRLGLSGAIHQLPFGCEFDVLRPAKAENESLRGLPNDHYMMAVGSIDGRKRHDLVVNAWMESGIYAHYKLFVAAYGSNPNDPFFDAYYAARQRTENVFFLQNIHDDEMALALRHAQFVIYPSSFEGWGLPVSEAAYFNKYCLVMGQGFSQHQNIIQFTPESLLPMAQERFRPVLERGAFTAKKPSWYSFIAALLAL